MTPIMNGVVLYLGNYHKVFRTDLYRVGDCYAFVVSPGQLVDSAEPPTDVHFLLRHIEDLIDLWRSPEDSPSYGLLITPRWRLEHGDLCDQDQLLDR